MSQQELQGVCASMSVSVNYVHGTVVWLGGFFLNKLKCLQGMSIMTSIELFNDTIFHTHTDCPPKKLQSALGYRLQKNPLWNQKNQTGLWNYDYFPTIQWRPHLIWPSNHKEMDFCKASHGSLSSKFCHLNVCRFHRLIVFTKDRLANIFKFYAYLSNKGCSWQPKSLSDM